MLQTSVGRLRLLGIVEGISLLVLLFICMPIKYIGGNPIPVKIVGMAHGVLFVFFSILLLNVSLEKNWTLKFSLMGFILSSVPFGTFYFDKKVKELETVEHA